MSLWLTSGAIFAVLVNWLGGTLVGFTMGYVPVTLQYEAYVANCSRYETAEACGEMAARSGCSWIDAWDVQANRSNPQCFFNDRVVHRNGSTANSLSCSSFDESVCSSGQEVGCYFDARARLCKHVAGWTPLQQGVFAAMMIVGSIVGSAAGGPLLARVARRPVLGLAGVIGVLAMTFQTVAWAENSFIVFVVARLLSGLSVGICSVLCPMYCGESAPGQLRNAIGVMFQTALCFGLFIASGVGVAVSPENDVRNVNGTVDRFHWVNGVGFLVSLILIPFAYWVVPEPPSTPRVDDEGPLLYGTIGDDDDHITSATSGKGTPGLWFFLVVAAFMATNQQLTGINAVCTYAPVMAASAGLAPLTGNAVVMAWNFLASCLCVPLALRFPLRRVYLIGSVAVCLSCALTTVFTYPDVVRSPATKNALELGGILMFLLAFECGPGPMFYVLSQSIFPSRYRGMGCGLCNSLQFVWNIVINFGYPLAQQGLSGGANADQDKGQALCFVIFGAIGAVCTVFLLRYMPK